MDIALMPEWVKDVWDNFKALKVMFTKQFFLSRKEDGR